MAIALIFGIFSNPMVVGAAAAKRELPIYCVQKDEKVASLSFDAAWGNEDTQLLIDILAKYDVKATFFVVGDWVTKYPESVLALHEAGHEVMNHSNKHKHMPQLSREQIIEDISSCNDKIAGVTGVSPTLFRPPYGEYDDKLVTTLRGMGMYTIQWDVDSLDWKDLSAPEITKRVLDRVKPGSLVLFHNAAKHTPEALPGIIESLQNDGYTLVRISEIIHPGEYTMDHEGRQIPAETPNTDIG
ncbi:MAG: polysaccharide deacetylase family protein [Oscillospiraceae bacterium]|nr:polysaccharide deacetylase family protein [Oscillospiraceae bacterium]